MPQLFKKDMIYIAQPPLYEIKEKGKKKSEYVLNEGQMRKRMENRGLEGTKLLIGTGETGKAEASGEKLSTLIKLLNDVERIIGVLQRRGIIFKGFIEKHYDGERLPTFYIKVESDSEYYHDKSEYEKRCTELAEKFTDQEKEKLQADAPAF